MVESRKGDIDMRIIDLKIGDENLIKQLAELLMDNFNHCWNTFEEASEEVLQSMGHDRISRVAINESGQAIGWIGGIEEYDGNVWELHPLVVNKKFQGKGIGRKLVYDFERIVAEKGGITIQLGTDDEDNKTSLGGRDIYDNLYDEIKNIKNIDRHPFEFYEKLGYKIVGVMPDANGFGKPDIYMAKRVNQR